MTNTHGLNIIGLNKSASDTRNYDHFSYKRNVVFYNTKTGDVWVEMRFTESEPFVVRQYHDPDIIVCLESEVALSEQDIADAIYNRILFLRDSKDYGTPSGINWSALHD